MTEKRINLLRLRQAQITSQQELLLQDMFPGCDLLFIETAPKNHQEVLDDCAKRDGTTTILSGDVPLPLPAIQAGHEFLIFHEDGTIHRVTDIQVISEQVFPPLD